MKALLEATPLAVAVCDRDGSLTLMSPALEQLVGPFERVHASAFVERFGVRDANGASLRTEDVPILRALRGELVRDVVVRARGDANRTLYLRINAAPATDPQGEVLGAVALVEDVTSEQISLRERDELRDRLIETVNHELRTPLAKIQGHAELLDDAVDQLPGTMARSVEVIGRASQELSALVDTISALTDLEAHTRLTKSEIDLAQLVREIVRDLPPERCARPGELMVEVPDRLRATVDPGEMRRAIIELLHNATTYGPPDCAIVVRAAGDRDTVAVTVADAGIGIPARDRTRLVQPFERGSHPQQAVSSKGLGLAIAHNVAAMHGGELQFGQPDREMFEVTIRVPRQHLVAPVPRRASPRTRQTR